MPSSGVPCRWAEDNSTCSSVHCTLVNTLCWPCLPCQVLKQRKLYEGQREQLYSQQFNMEQTRFTVDSIKDTVTMVQSSQAVLKEMKTAMKKNKELDINYIDKMQDDMFDMMVRGARRARCQHSRVHGF